MKRVLEKISILIKKLHINARIEYFNHHYIVNVLFWCVFLDYLIEAASRHSILQPFLFVIKNPVIAIYNILILFILLGTGILFRKRILYAGIMSVICLTFGISNGVVLSCRVTPLSAVDFTLIGDVSRIIDLYLSWFDLVLIILGVLLLFGICIFLGIKCPKYTGKIYRLPAAFMIAFYFLAMVGLDNMIVSIGVAPKNYSNLADAYKDYGFVYCFTNSFLKMGMEKPNNYSKEIVQDILDESITNSNNSVQLPNPDGENDETAMDVSEPNIIFVQLESVFDISNVIGLETSQDALPNLHRLMQNNTTGFLYVPSIGAGTVNTEFEVLTGLNLDFFGPGEYPYKTILQNTTCESAAYDLKELGYTAHAIHNNSGTFYDRNLVYTNLGFDSYTSVEYMYNIERNVINFAKDKILTKEILDTLNITEGRDFIFTVSVQAHGEYADERRGEPQPVFIRYKDEDKENAWSYYVNQIYEVDQFVGDLVLNLSMYNEPVVVVFYGDHLPSLNLTNEDIKNDRLTATSYVMWSNFEIERADEDVESYQLMSKVLNMLGIRKGIINSYHYTHAGNIDYLEKLELLQYDMLYGEKEIFSGKNPYLPTQMQMGIRRIKVFSVSQEEEDIFIRGVNFNDYSVVFCNGSPLSTTYIDKNTLKVNKTSLRTGDSYKVGQVGNDKECLGFSNEYVID